MIKYKSEKYYREINSNKDIIKFKLQLGAISLKLNEHDLNIINNDKDIKSNYDICVSNKNSLVNIDRKIYATNSNITNIHSDNESINKNITKMNSDVEKINKKDIIKHNYSIENIWFFNIDIWYDYILTKSEPIVILYEHEIESKFTVNSILEISCNILYKYANYNNIGLLDVNDNLIQTHYIIHTNSGDNYTNHLMMDDNFSFLFKNSRTDRLKIRLEVALVNLNRDGSIGFRIMNPYKNNILRVKYVEYLSEK